MIDVDDCRSRDRDRLIARFGHDVAGVRPQDASPIGSSEVIEATSEPRESARKAAVLDGRRRLASLAPDTDVPIRADEPRPGRLRWVVCRDLLLPGAGGGTLPGYSLMRVGVHRPFQLPRCADARRLRHGVGFVGVPPRGGRRTAPRGVVVVDGLPGTVDSRSRRLRPRSFVSHHRRPHSSSDDPRSRLPLVAGTARTAGA